MHFNGRDFLKITSLTNIYDDDAKKMKIDLCASSRSYYRKKNAKQEPDSHCKYHGLCLRNVSKHMENHFLRAPKNEQIHQRRATKI